MSKAVREILGEIAEETRKLIRRIPERPAADLVARANAFVFVRVFLDRVIEPMKKLSKLDRKDFEKVIGQLDDLSHNVDRINPHTLSVIGGRVDDILDATSVLKHGNVLKEAQTYASKMAEIFRSFSHIYSVSYLERHHVIDKVLRISEEIEDA